MKVKVLLVVLIVFYKINLNAAEAGMPQLDPTYWFSQAFWLILIFSLFNNGNIDTIKKNIKAAFPVEKKLPVLLKGKSSIRRLKRTAK